MVSISKDKQIIQVTLDHKPSEDSERKRIEYNGGEVYRNVSKEDEVLNKKPPFRVYPGRLSVSRAIGDHHLKK